MSRYEANSFPAGAGWCQTAAISVRQELGTTRQSLIIAGQALVIAGQELVIAGQALVIAGQALVIARQELIIARQELVSIALGLWSNPMVCKWLLQPLSSIARSLSETPME